MITSLRQYLNNNNIYLEWPKKLLEYIAKNYIFCPEKK